MSNLVKLSEALAAAAIPYLGNVSQAKELANNVAMFPLGARTENLEAHIAMAIRHRQSQGWAQCGDVDSCAVAMARAMRREAAKVTRVVGKRGPAFGGAAWQTRSA